MIRVKGLLEDISGASRVTKIREDNFNKASDLNHYEDKINLVAKELHPDPFLVICKEIKQVSITAKKFRFEPLNGFLPYFQAGNYVCIYFDADGIKTQRPYSISSAPTEAHLENPYFEVTIRQNKNGSYESNYLYNNLKVNDKLTVSMPHGHFYYEELRDAKNVLAIAGGSGITPFYSMALEVMYGNLDIDLTILYGSVSNEDIILEKEFKEITNKTNRVKIINVLSGRDAVIETGFEKGFITRDLIKKYSYKQDPLNELTSYFVCGPLLMYEFITNELKALNVKQRRIRMEVFGGPKNIKEDKDYPLDVLDEYKITVIRGIEKTLITAKSKDSLAESLERNGIMIRTCCRSGECGACRIKVISGDYFVPKVSDFRRKADISFGYVHSCKCYPLSDMTIKINILKENL